MVASSWRQFLLLLWKNWLLQKRRKVLTAFEIGLPIIMSIILVAVRQLTSSTPYPDPRIWEPFSIETFQTGFNPPRLNSNCTGIFCVNVDEEMWRVAYAPNTSLTRNIIHFASNKLNLSYTGKFSFTFHYFIREILINV